MDRIKIDLKGSKVLVVDDLPDNLDVLCRSLEDTGYNVMVATDGQSALEVADYAGPDLILLDVMMPGMDGYETCRRLKAAKKTAETPVIFLTARDETEGIVEGFQVGGVDYVTKPFKKEELLVRIRTHLTMARLAHNLAELNAHLEEKVVERTLQLQLKVSELEGKDRIAQHMLEFNALEDTLNLVLKTIAEVLGMNRAVIYLLQGGQLNAAAAIGLTGAEQVSSAEELQTFTASAEEKSALAEVQTRLQPRNNDKGDQPFATVPILRSGTLLGIVQTARQDRPIASEEMDTLVSFALQAAVAISDAQVRQDPAAWEDQLDEVLEMHEELEDVATLEQLSAEADERAEDRQ
jgi:DNA-binding response OmpR family regulator